MYFCIAQLDRRGHGLPGVKQLLESIDVNIYAILRCGSKFQFYSTARYCFTTEIRKVNLT